MFLKKRQTTCPSKTRGKTKTAGPEELLQGAIVDYLNVIKPRCFWFHVPNGMACSSIQTARKFKRLGMRAGVSDFVFLLPEGKTGLMELKSDRGKTSPAQDAFAHAARALGHDYRIVRDLSQFERVLLDWGAIDRPCLTRRSPFESFQNGRRGKKTRIVTPR